MKKRLFSLICAFALIISSCTKDKTASPKDEKLYPVTFDVSTFSKEIVPMASLKTIGQIDASTAPGKSLSDAIEYLNYVVYNESGTKINGKLIRNSTPNFGKIEDSLPKGRYSIVVTGSAVWYPNITDYFYGGGVGFHSQPGTDIFFAQIDLEVGGDGVNRSLQLIRKVGKIEIDLTDQIPSDIEGIVHTVDGISTSFYFQTNGNLKNSGSMSNYIPYLEGQSTNPNQEPSLYFFLAHDQPSMATVNIRAYTKDGNLVVNKTINDVPVSINKKTILTGRLFDDGGTTKGQAFSVSIDDKWRSDINHVGF